MHLWPPDSVLEDKVSASPTLPCNRSLTADASTNYLAPPIQKQVILLEKMDARTPGATSGRGSKCCTHRTNRRGHRSTQRDYSRTLGMQVPLRPSASSVVVNSYDCASGRYLPTPNLVARQCICFILLSIVSPAKNRHDHQHPASCLEQRSYQGPQSIKKHHVIV